MAAYDIRLQVTVPDSFTYNGIRRELAKQAQRLGATAILVDGDRWDPSYASFDEEWDSSEGGLEDGE